MSSAARGSFPLVLLLLCTEHPPCMLVAEEGAKEEGGRIEEREEAGERGGWKSLFIYTHEMYLTNLRC